MTDTKKALLFDCSHGISGDMSVGALLSLGASKENLLKKLDELNIPGFSINITKLNKHNKIVWDYDVILDESFYKSSIRRNINDIYKIIDASSLNFSEKDISKHIFNIAATAGANAHKVPINEFYFHESGAVDSLADIIGIAICFHDIMQNNKIDEVFLLELVDGYGPIILRNGRSLPIPVPAVYEIVFKHQIPYRQSNVLGELITPTGASFAAFIYSKTITGIPVNYKIIKTGFGNGKRSNDSKSILRIDIIEWKI